MSDAHFDALVIGAGQAGLAAGYHLAREGLHFRIVERATRIGDSWRKRYGSLTLFTPRDLSALPGVPLTGDSSGYPSGGEFADYLEAYAARWNLAVVTDVRVIELVRQGNGFLATQSDGSSVSSRTVVVATGGFQEPVRPAIAGGFDASVTQLDSETYRSPKDVPPGRVLVVGDGASGRDLVMELAGTHETLLATGRPRRLFPERILGKSVWWWFRKLGLMRAPAETFLGRSMRRADPFPDRNRNLPKLRAAGVRIVPRLLTAEGRSASFADGTQIDINTVVWAVGYRDNFDWLAIREAKAADGRVVHTEGVSPVSGLYFVGRPWQRNRASGLVMGAGDDAAAIVQRVALAASNDS